MPRTRVKTTNRQTKTDEEIRQAVSLVLDGVSYGIVSEQSGIPKATLIRYVKKSRLQTDGGGNINNLTFQQRNNHLQVFSREEENLLVVYLKEASNMCYGLSAKEVRRLAYEYGYANNKNMRANWHKDSMAGREWLFSFMKRYNLSMRTPQQVSLSRATSFNPINVGIFFENLKEIMLKHKFDPCNIYNIDETAVKTVHNPPKIVTEKGSKTVGKAVSAERGILVTFVGIINATGRAVPPFFIFPRKNFKKHMLNGCYPGSDGSATPSGWISGEVFLEVLRHFVKNESPTKTNPKLIILDNHESHISIAAIEFCREHGIVLLTLPPHTSHKLQPLDVSVFGPFKKYYNVACDNWMTTHGGRTLTIYDIAERVAISFPKAFTPENIINGFRATGIYPLNELIFSEVDYMTSNCTYRRSLSNEQPIHPPSSLEESSNLNTNELSTVSSGSSDILPVQSPKTPCCSQSEKIKISPRDLRPYPHADSKNTRIKRNRKKSSILTSTPVKDTMIAEAESKELAIKLKKDNAEKRAQKKQTKLLLKEKEARRKRKHVEVTSSSESSDENDVETQDTDSDLESFSEETDHDQNWNHFITPGSYVVVKVYRSDQKSFRNYIAKINTIGKNDYNVTFLKRHLMTNNFWVTEDEFRVKHSELVTILKSPTIPSSKRFRGMLNFVDINDYSLI